MVRFVDGDGFCSQLARDGDTRQVVYASLVARVATDPVFGGASGGSGEVSGGSGGRPYPGSFRVGWSQQGLEAGNRAIEVAGVDGGEQAPDDVDADPGTLDGEGDPDHLSQSEQ